MQDRTNNPNQTPQTRRLGPLPCPWWCASRDTEHAASYSSVHPDNPGIEYRTHVHTFGADLLAVVQEEINDNGKRWLDPPAVHIYSDACETVAEVREMAAALTAAAGLLEATAEWTGAAS